MRLSQPVDRFRLAYDHSGRGEGPPVVLLHGWPGDRTDYADVVPLLAGRAEVLVPDLRGFGGSDKHPADPPSEYSAEAQARSVLGLIEELKLSPPVLAGYDIGSRIAQAVAAAAPERVRALVVTPPLPGVGTRILEPAAQREFWYQSLHRLPLADELLDGEPGAVRAYLRHFWTHWSGPDHALDEARLEHLVSVYGAPGAFTASIAWYRAGAGSVARSLAEKVPAPGDRLPVPTSVLWPEYDPLFPREWADRVAEFFADATLSYVDGVGHFTPLEAPTVLADAIIARLP